MTSDGIFGYCGVFGAKPQKVKSTRMTLLLAAANPSGVHQSSDFRLTEPRTRSATESCGAKQLGVRIGEWQAEISFTGIAEANNVRTVDVLTQLLATATPATITELAERVHQATDQHVRALRGVSGCQKALTVLITAVQQGKDPRLILISNIDSLIRARNLQVADQFELSERSACAPLHIMCGCVEAVEEEDRKLLRYLSDCTLSPAEIREQLAGINKRAASHPTHGHWISAGCMVTSLLRDGTMQLHNDGAIAGVPARFLGPLNLAEIVQKNFRTAPGKKITLVQSAAAGPLQGRPMPQPEGQLRTFAYSVPRSSYSIVGDATITLEPNEGTVQLRKNEWVSAAFNAVSYRVGGSLPPNIKFRLANAPTVDGQQPRSWDYLIQTTSDAQQYGLTISPMSVAFRSANLPAPMPLLGPQEELVMAAPREGLTLSVPKCETSATGVIEAKFLLRDFPEIESQQRQSRINEWKRTTSRNDPCPCGSGKKFKKCCGFLP